MIQKDFIERLLERLGQVLRKVAQREQSGQHEEALDELREAYRELFGLDQSTLCMLDAPTLLAMLQSPEQLSVLLPLIRADIELQQTLGREGMGRVLATAGLELLAHAPSAAVRAEDVVFLLNMVPEEKWSPRLRSVASKWR